MSSFNPARFANPHLTDTLTVPCPCPGTPHEEGDTVVHRTELGAGEEARAGVAGWASTGGQYFDWEVARDKLIEIGVVRWTFVGEENADKVRERVPVTLRSASLLPEEIRNAIAERLDKATLKPAEQQAEGPEEKPRPNRSGARSRSGSRANASRTRTARTPH